MTTSDVQQFKDMLKASEDRIMARLDAQDAEIRKAADFQTVFTGAIKILTALVILGAGLATIYVAFRGGGGKG